MLHANVVFFMGLSVATLFSGMAFAQRPGGKVANQYEANIKTMVKSHEVFSSSQKTGDFSALCVQKNMSVACMDTYLAGKLKSPISPVESTLLMAEAVTAALSVSLDASMPKNVAQCQKIYLLGSWSYKIVSARIEASVGMPDYQTLKTEEERAEWKEVLRSIEASIPEATTGARDKLKVILAKALQSYPENVGPGELVACSRDLKMLVSRF